VTKRNPFQALYFPASRPPTSGRARVSCTICAVYALVDHCHNKEVINYRAMHFSAKRGIAIACRLSVCPSVRLSVCDVDEL